MAIGWKSAWSTGWLAAMLFAGCPALAGSADEPPQEQAMFNLGKTVLTADELRELNGLPADEKRHRLDDVLALHPDDLAARFFRTQAEVTLTDDAAVISDTEAVLANAALDPRARLWALEWRAEALLHSRRFDETIAVATLALEIDSSSEGALFARGWARFLNDASHADDALADLDRALTINPNEGIGFMRRGDIRMEQGKFDLAAEDFERAVRLAPNDGPSHRQYGILLYRTHDLERALAQFDAAAGLMPNDPFALTWRAQAKRGLKRFEAAAADDKLADELGAGEDLSHAITNVGAVLFDQEDFEGAARQFRRSLALKAEPAVAASLAQSLWFSGHVDQALESLRQSGALPMSGDYGPLWLFLMRGRADPARESEAKAELAAHALPHQPHAWTDTLIDMVLGRTTLETALAEADASPTDKLKAGRRCEADYYAAEQLLMRGQDKPADRLLEEAYWVCPSTYFEAKAVNAERRLQEAKSSRH